MTGLVPDEGPSLKSIADRRMQLWGLTLFLLITAVTVLSTALLISWVNFEVTAPKVLVYAGIVVLVIVFSAYAVKTELELRALTQNTVDERLLATALINSLREANALDDGGDSKSRLDLNETFETILESALEHLDGQGGSIMMLHSKDELHTAFSAGSSAARGARVVLGEGIAGQVAQTGEPILITGVYDWKHYQPQEDTPHPTSSICVPLFDGDNLTGVLSVNAKPGRRFSDGELRAASRFAVRAGSAIALAQERSKRRQLVENLHHQAMHDPLTGLPNRALLLDRVNNAIARRRPPDRAVVLLFVDLDDFKRVNDSLGHAAGDQILIALAERLRASVRAGDSVAHFGSDEFAVLLEASDSEEATGAAKRILGDLTKPFSLEGRELLFSASIGIALEYSNDIQADEMVRNAFTALHSAKSKGKGQVSVFEQSMHSTALDRLDLEHELRTALEENGLDVFLQPLMHLSNMTVHGFEALVRWHHPKRGLVAAVNFVPMAEEAGLQPLIDRMVLQKTCAKMAELNAGIFADAPAAAHVNLSPSTLNEPDYVSNLAADVMASGLDPGHLVLEITEGVIMHDVEQAASKLRAIKSLGIRLALDDFGTGYSSLSYLRRFPVDVVKIDKMFVDEIEKDSGAAALVQAIIRLGEGLSFEVVAEGIETEDQLKSLIDLGCIYGQGYYMARPLSRSELNTFLDNIGKVSC